MIGYNSHMRYVAFAIWMLIVPAPLLAQADEQPPQTLDETIETLRDGADALLRHFMQEIEPALRDMAPLLQDLSDFAAELPGYHSPEVLPNGDILLRRKTPDPAENQETTPDDSDTEPSSPEEPVEL